uniref:ATP synthase subunit a n=2 Tax=Gobionellinae TaxID=497220 RepID=M4PZS6_9GOBI|nr:ATP synthase F0 subunit 6 [Chaeturichthys stigmatias]YP_009229144.1 ATP synthase F0 subunit 6 [Amblychaeturichthys hexanema]AGH15493.1 ATP synthase F0 subunit 6 [Chaeturichthys stigmatias]ALS46759.1 ATP synthase F0 subunit 6 [Amblychaeturichthys hexanema]QDA81965.1 ATP synthase F0 subunit 6 [Chaeturichthys stigmatias]
MMTSLFDQFLSPVRFGIPLIALALLIPWYFFPFPTSRWMNNRVLTLQNQFINRFISQLLLPMNIPGHKWATMFAALLLFIVSLNMLGLLPYTFTPTTQLSFSLGLAVPLWMATVLIGFRNQPTNTLGHLLPEGTPAPLIPVLIIIETISLFIRPMALGVRLTANLTAGHLLMHLIALAAYSMIFSAPAVAAITTVVLLLLTLLEVAVAMIQAYVFVLLLSLYLQENV